MKITKKHLLAGVLSLFVLSLIFVPSIIPAFAQEDGFINQLPTPPNYMVGGNANIKATIQTILNTVLGFLGFIAVIVILIGGFMWMTAGGDEDKVGKAKKTLGAGIIGK